jgi:hypothetical protein
VEVIEDEGRLRQMGAHGVDVGLGHVYGHRLDARTRAPESFPERSKGVGTFPLPDDDHGSRFQVQHHCQVALALAEADIIDGQQS